MHLIKDLFQEIVELIKAGEIVTDDYRHMCYHCLSAGWRWVTVPDRPGYKFVVKCYECNHWSREADKRARGASG